MDISSIDDIVDSTYVINMDSDTVRLQQFDAMMAASNWRYTRHSAINGKKLLSSWNDVTDPVEYNQLKEQLSLKKKYVHAMTRLSPGEIGCLLSHVTLLEKVAYDPDKNRIAIFEDDARTHVDGDTIYRLLKNFYCYLSENNIPEPDMLYLGKAVDDCMSYEKVWNNVYTSRHPLCLHAYIITKQGARKLLNRSPFIRPIDIIPIKAIEQGILNVMTFHPSIYFQDIFNNTSNLRKITAAINHTTECLVFQQYITEDTWQYTVVIIVGVIAAIFLFLLFMWTQMPLF